MKHKKFPICILMSFILTISAFSGFGVFTQVNAAKQYHAKRENKVDGWRELMRQFGLSESKLQSEKTEWMKRAENHYASHYYGTPYYLDGGESHLGPKGYVSGGNLFGREVDGLDVDSVKQHWHAIGNMQYFGTSGIYNNLMNTLQLDYRQYKCKQDLLDDGWAEKGDIIFATTYDASVYTNQVRSDGQVILQSNNFYPNQGRFAHVMVYWGDSPGEDLCWQSVDKLYDVGQQGQPTSNISTGAQQPGNYQSRITGLIISNSTNNVYSTDGCFLSRLTSKYQPANWTVFKLGLGSTTGKGKVKKTF